MIKTIADHPYESENGFKVTSVKINSNFGFIFYSFIIKFKDIFYLLFFPSRFFYKHNRGQLSPGMKNGIF